MNKEPKAYPIDSVIRSKKHCFDLWEGSEYTITVYELRRDYVLAASREAAVRMATNRYNCAPRRYFVGRDLDKLLLPEHSKVTDHRYNPELIEYMFECQHCGLTYKSHTKPEFVPPYLGSTPEGYMCRECEANRKETEAFLKEFFDLD